jgi:hypothetical protein
MSLPDDADIELFFHGSLIVLKPRNERTVQWILANLKPTGWQFGPAGTFLADKTEFIPLSAWLSRDGIQFVVMNPDHEL